MKELRPYQQAAHDAVLAEPTRSGTALLHMKRLPKTKVCRLCKKRKLRSRFANHSLTKDGLDGRCWPCKNAQPAAREGRRRWEKSHRIERLAYRREKYPAYRKKNKKKLNTQNRERYRSRTKEQKEKARETYRKYYFKNKEKVKEHVQKRLKKNKQKRIAKYTVTNGLKRGTLIKKSCQKCGTLKVEAHHPDYSKPLLIVWLCKKHHAAVHRKYPEEWVSR